MEFCPTCGNMLLYEKPDMDHRGRFCCPTCPYVAPIENQVNIERHLRLVKKPIARIVDDDVMANLPKTNEVSCPDCGHGEAVYQEMQTRSADEPATIYYTCTRCKKVWIDN